MIKLIDKIISSITVYLKYKSSFDKKKNIKKLHKQILKQADTFNLYKLRLTGFLENVHF